VDFVFHDLDGVAPRFGLRRPFHQRGIVHRGIPFGSQPNLLCPRNVHAHFNKFDCFSATSIDLRREVQNRRGPGDVPRQFAIVGFEFTEVVEGPKPHGRCGCRWLGTVRLPARRRSPGRHILNSPLHRLPARVIESHLSGQIFRLKEVEKPEDSGLILLGGRFLVAPRQDQAED
jgi:hypothetical protein